MTRTKVAERKETRNGEEIQLPLARVLEHSGNYEGAREALAGIWSALGERPSIETLSAELQAEALLRAGSLTGWIGTARQLAGTQEFAKDLISEAIRGFEVLGNSEKVAEAQTDLAICYWRLGALDEGRVLFGQALKLSRDPENRLRVLVNSSAVEISSGHMDQAMRLLNEAAPLVDVVSDRGATGRYHLQRALVFKKLGGTDNLDRALIEYSAASLQLNEAGDTRYLAAIENNIGLVHLELGRHGDAIAHLDRARTMFVTLRDASKVAEVNEARAQAFIAEQSFVEAERAAFAAVTTFERGDEHSLLATSLATHGIALARLGKRQAARSAFLRAAQIADSAGDSHSAGNAYLLMMEELASDLEPTQVAKFFLAADERLASKVDLNTLVRLTRCARVVAANSAGENGERLDDLLIGGSLEQEILHVEAVLIKRALNQVDGSVTRAARLLGLTHQGLDWTLRHRQKQLLNSRTPRRTRRRSALKKA